MGGATKGSTNDLKPILEGWYLTKKVNIVHVSKVHKDVYSLTIGDLITRHYDSFINSVIEGGTYLGNNSTCDTLYSNINNKE